MKRYIDAEKLKEEWIDEDRTYYFGSAFVSSIDEQPTADVRENVHGEWIKNEGRYGWHCSVCKVDDIYAYRGNSETDELDLQDRFCPNCGADMRGVHYVRKSD